MSRDVVRLSYRQIHCSRCGAPRIVAVPCPDCGAPADVREADPGRQDRHRRARRALAILDAAPAIDPYRVADLQDIDRLLGRLAGWHHSFLAALDVAAQGGRESDAVLDAPVTELAELLAAVTSAAVLRPWTAVWRHVTEVVQRMNDVARAFLGAFSADVPLDAQFLARKGQAAIDAVSEPLARISDLKARMERLAEASTVAERLQLEARELYDSTGAPSILELARSGQALYAELGGTAGEVPPSAGLMLGLIDMEAATFLDRHRFLTASREALVALGRRRTTADRAFRDPAWLGGFQDGTQRLLDASVDFTALFGAARQDRDAVRAIVALGHTLIEGPGRRYLALVLSALGTRPRESLLAGDAFAVVDMAKAAGMPVIADGFPRAVRHAKAHETWQFDATGIRVSANEPTIDIFTLVDQVLALYESVVALHCAIGAALIDGGIPELLAFPGVDLGFRSEEMIATVLELADLRTAGVSIDGADLSCDVAGVLDREAIGRVGMLTPWLPESVEHVSITARSGDAAHVMEGPAEPLRQFARSVDELEHGADFVRTCAQWTLDAEPLLADDYIRKWIAMQAGGALKLDIRERTRRLRFLMGLAKERLLPDIADALAAAIATSRAVQLELPDESLSERMQPLIEWERRRLPSPFEQAPSASARRSS